MNIGSIVQLATKPQLEAAAVTQSAIKGENGTGYESGDKGLFQCRNCEYFSGVGGNTCGQKIMMEMSKQPRVNSGRVIVDPKGCCEYIDRKGR
jgi:hypothetical protein